MDCECTVEKAEYNNGRTALYLIHKQDRDLVAVVSVNLPEYPLKDDEIFIKDYSENYGIMEVLENAGIIEDTGQSAKSGFEMIPKVKLIWKDKPEFPEGHHIFVREHYEKS